MADIFQYFGTFEVIFLRNFWTYRKSSGLEEREERRWRIGMKNEPKKDEEETSIVDFRFSFTFLTYSISSLSLSLSLWPSFSVGTHCFQILRDG